MEIYHSDHKSFASIELEVHLKGSTLQKNDGIEKQPINTMKAAREDERQDLKANEKSWVCLYMILVMNAKTTQHRNQEGLLSFYLQKNKWKHYKFVCPR